MLTSAAAAAALVAALAAPAPAAVGGPVSSRTAPGWCPATIQILKPTGARTVPRATYPVARQSRLGPPARFAPGRFWSSKRVNGWASLGGLEGGAWRHGPWLAPGSYRVLSQRCDWRHP